jgi:hypothetical protein
MFAQAQQLAEQWAAVPHHQSFVLHFPATPG